MTRHLAELLEPYGVAPDSIVDLGKGPKPDTIRYLDLVQEKASDSERPDAVVEAEHEPLAYVVDATRRTTEPELPTLRRKLALRGDAPYLVVVAPGRLTLYDVALDKRAPRSRDVLSEQEERARTVFYRLHVSPSADSAHRRFVHEVLFELLSDAVDGLHQECRVDRDDAISLAGRALFARFLIDREILSPEQTQQVCPEASRAEDFFSSPERAEATCGWLDDTFNGDFLPLSFWPKEDGFGSLREEAFGLLSDILHRAPGGQLRFDWGDLDFAHIPVGLLSQVYEWQAERWDPSGQKAKSVYYTPRRIAEYMVREVFAGLEEQGPVPPHTARVLDPAVGGAVFLVAAFEEITAAWWRHHRRSPDTRELRSILYEQLTGFDVGEPSLRLAALSLYLKAIELDLDPHPVEKLRFEPLRGRVLYDVGDNGNSDSTAVLGSLGPKAGGEHAGRYDVVVGNPPWTALKGDQGRSIHKQMVEAVGPVAKERLGEERTRDFQIPDKVPDLPFVWRAMQWARPSGWLSFALHGRLLFKASAAGSRARQDLFEALTVTGVLNGADLRKTQVWPQMAQPFALLFAVNECPPDNHAFHFVSPYLEKALNGQGRLRVDAQAAYPISVGRLSDEPKLLKALFRGTSLDMGVLTKVRKKRWPSLAGYWESESLADGQGYQIARGRQDASSLKGLPNLTTESGFRFVVETKNLPSFEMSRIHRPRKREIYRGPLLLVRKSPPEDRNDGRALVCWEDVVYNESFYGYSAYDHPEGRSLVRLLLLLLHSELFLWNTLVSSGEFGVERESIQKLDVERFPIPPIETLGADLLEEARDIFNQLVSETEAEWSAVDDWTAKIYGLDRWDQEVIRDTLAVALPFPTSRDRAQRAPRPSEIQTFENRLREELQPIGRASSRQLRVSRLPGYEDSPWEVLAVETGPGDRAARHHSSFVGTVLSEADDKSASQLILVDPSRQCLLLAILRQYRYWTPTRARLCALEIVHDHSEVLF